MKTTHNLKRAITAAMLTGGVAVAGLGLGAGVAQANSGPLTWCPGQSVYLNGIKVSDYDWDLNACHTFYEVGYGQGNVGYKLGPASTIWEGPNPPAPKHDPLCPPGPVCYPWL